MCAICSFGFVYFLFCFLSSQEMSFWAPGCPGLGVGKEACNKITVLYLKGWVSPAWSRYRTF